MLNSSVLISTIKLKYKSEPYKCRLNNAQLQYVLAKIVQHTKKYLYIMSPDVNYVHGPSVVNVVGGKNYSCEE